MGFSYKRGKSRQGRSKEEEESPNAQGQVLRRSSVITTMRNYHSNGDYTKRKKDLRDEKLEGLNQFDDDDLFLVTASRKVRLDHRF